MRIIKAKIIIAWNWDMLGHRTIPEIINTSIAIWPLLTGSYWFMDNGSCGEMVFNPQYRALELV
jgi:hypothetical protein